MIVEAATLREEMEGDHDFLAPLYKHPSYATYQAFFEEKKGVTEEILKDWQAHGTLGLTSHKARKIRPRFFDPT